MYPIIQPKPSLVYGDNAGDIFSCPIAPQVALTPVSLGKWTELMAFVEDESR